MSEILRLAIQKSGRLFEATQTLLRECDIDFDVGKTLLKSRAQNFPVELYFLRDDDIPAYVADGVADAGIVGRNALAESRTGLPEIEPLGFGRCRLSLAIPRETAYAGLDDFAGKRITTSHPNILAEYLRANRITSHIHEVHGSVEIAPSIGLADAICDLVSTGGTLASNGLKEVETVLASEAVIVARNGLDQARRKLLDELIFRTRAVRRARHTKYIMLNAPNDSLSRIIGLIPGAKSPSVLPLAETGWSSVHSVVSDERFWEVIGSLKAAGAQGILVLPIEKMIE